MSTLIIYPDAGTGGTTVDGTVQRSGVNETFSNIRSGAGVSAAETGTTLRAELIASHTENQYKELGRIIMTFDTSSLGLNAYITSVMLSPFASAGRDVLGSPTAYIAGATPASNNALVAGDYSQVQTTSFGEITADNYKNGSYSNVILNASGVSNIKKNGISCFSLQLSWDILNDTTGLTWVDQENSHRTFTAADIDGAGTTRDPKLTIEYSYPAVLHQFKEYVSGDSVNLEWEGQSTVAPSESEIFLQIFNRNTEEWDTVDSDSTTAADTDFVLTADMLDLTDYKSTGGVVSCRVYQIVP